MISIDEFAERILRNIKLRREQLLRNITVKDGHPRPETGWSGSVTTPYTVDELELLRSIESDLRTLLILFDDQAEKIGLPKDTTWTVGT